MKKNIFKMEVFLDTEEKSVEAHLGIDEEKFDPEAIAMFKEVVSEFSKAIAVGYTKEILSFSNEKESEVKA